MPHREGLTSACCKSIIALEDLIFFPVAKAPPSIMIMYNA